MNKFVPRRKVLEILNIHYQTLYRMIERKEIETIKVGNQIMYNLDKYLKIQNASLEIKKRICYCRVSTIGQKSDLIHQIELMKTEYPNHEIIQDIASGLKFNRPGLNKIIKMALNKEISELVVMYKDRLARFGYELIEDLINQYSNGKIIVIEQEEQKEPTEELVQDVLQIMNIFVAKLNGMRRYGKA